MTKYIGAVVIIVSCVYSTLKAVKKLRDREKSMQSLCTSMEILKDEISNHLTPIPEVFEMLAERSQYPANKLYKNALEEMKNIGSCSFFSIWKKAVAETEELLLTEPEKQVLGEIGLTLGRYDVKNQEGMINRVISRFDFYRKRAEDDRRQNTKTQAYLGIISGVFVVIVLL